MPETVNGLPVHVLLVHAVVVLVPLCALLLVLAALSPRLRVRLGGALPLLAAACLVLVPVTTHAGALLEHRVGNGGLVARHAHLGRQLLPWAAALLAASLLVWWRGRDVADPAADRRAARTPAGSLGAARTHDLVSVAVLLVALVVAAGSTIEVVRIGESGARAVWSGVGQQS